MSDHHHIFALGDFELQHGATLTQAVLAYQCYGTLNEARSNAIVYPTWFSGRHWENEWLIGADKALNPHEYFIIVPNMLGNGLSSSPSNTAAPYNGPYFPRISYLDQIRAQHKLITEKFGIRQLKAVVGWSMAAAQCFQWALSYPEMVPKIFAFCGSARTSEHNKVFLDAVRAAITTDVAFANGHYQRQPANGLRAAARVYASWGFSQAFYWKRLYRKLGYSSLEDFIIRFWDGFFLDQRDANNLLCMLDTWWHGDIGDTPGFNGDHQAALAAIQAQAVVMPAERDLYFPVEDEIYEVSFMPNASLQVIPGVWGHFAGSGINPVDTAFIDHALAELLSSDISVV
ncbi:alpha/beta fold hydrolase [Acinetobacter larvae]|uniref:AB hydrolase-1 domain-containing protein n=1 Tax=Acinetobacter larvae TaxID=1789224 RepID=A0A1B2LVH6_9GAMM|nr:alpha/beta fold hydrolase [Acinetobacter larvae]AOA56915.1 hypothetical protein BFG52_00075 [Acinetobacter larvae]